MGEQMQSAMDISIWLAFSAGILSFISPCTLPLYPAYLSYITGISVADLQQRQSSKIRFKVVLHTIFFLLGISTIYITLGVSASFIGEFFLQYRKLIQQISGVLVLVMGLFLIGFFKIEWLMQEKRFQFSQKPVGYLGSALVGMGFAAGWTPCIGPILTVIIALAASNPSNGMTYMTAYILGFSVPFIVLSFFLSTTRWLSRYSSSIMKIGGFVMIVMGVLLYTDQIDKISIYLLRLFEGTWLSRLG